MKILPVVSLLPGFMVGYNILFFKPGLAKSQDLYISESESTSINIFTGGNVNVIATENEIKTKTKNSKVIEMQDEEGKGVGGTNDDESTLKNLKATIKNGRSWVSLADGKDRFLSQVSFILDKNGEIYGGYNISLTFNQAVLWIDTLDLKFLATSEKNHTYIFQNHIWEPDLLQVDHRYDYFFQGICEYADPQIDILEASLTYNSSIQVLSPPLDREINQEEIPISTALTKPSIEKYNLARAIQLSNLFYEAERSGDLDKFNAEKDDEEVRKYKKTRIPWKHSCGMTDIGLYNQSITQYNPETNKEEIFTVEKSTDLSGGYFDAGDHIKFTLPMAYTTTIISWSFLLNKKAYESIPNEVNHTLATIKWALDYFMAAHPEKDIYFVQVGDKPNSHYQWTRPEDMTEKRKAYYLSCAEDKPGSEPIYESVAALASGHLVFKEIENMNDYANELLKHAIELFEMTSSCEGTYVGDGKIPADCCYGGHGDYRDEKAWSAMWLYKATQEEKYADIATNIFPPNETSKVDYRQPFDWDHKQIGALVLLHEYHSRHSSYTSNDIVNRSRKKQILRAFDTSTSDATTKTNTNTNIDTNTNTNESIYGKFVEKYLNERLEKMTFTPSGLMWESEWGCLRSASNTANLALIAAKMNLGSNPEDPKRYQEFAKNQIYYILGDNPRSTKNIVFSYQIGFADSFPRCPHHRAASCTDLNLEVSKNPLREVDPASAREGKAICECSTWPSYHILYGALVGGPLNDDSYFDRCPDFVHNEVACDYNAGFQSALAGLKTLSLDGNL